MAPTGEPDDAATVLGPCACFNVRSAARAITSLYDRALEPTGLKTHQFAILAVVRAHTTVTMQQLASELGLDPSTMTRTMRPLETQDLVRIAAGSDRRVKELVLTGNGERVFRQAHRMWRRAQDRLRELVGDDAFARLVDDLAVVTGKINEATQTEGVRS